MASSLESKLKAPKLRMLEHKAHSDWKRQCDEGEGNGMVPKSSKTFGFCVLRSVDTMND